MRKIILALLLLTMTTITASASEMYLVVLSQGDEQIEVSVDGDWKTEDIRQGLNCRTYKTENTPDVAVLSPYGDMIPIKTVQDKSGDWFGVLRIAPPEDGEGECYD